jgi:glutaredoxin-related protein
LLKSKKEANVTKYVGIPALMYGNNPFILSKVIGLKVVK